MAWQVSSPFPARRMVDCDGVLVRVQWVSWCLTKETETTKGIKTGDLMQEIGNAGFLLGVPRRLRGGFKGMQFPWEVTPAHTSREG